MVVGNTAVLVAWVMRINRLVIVQSDGPRSEIMRPARLVVIVLLDYRKT